VSDSIFVEGLLVHARHGLLEHESELGQRFRIDLKLSIDLARPSYSDDIEDTVSYGDVVATAIRAFESTKYRLLEAAAGAIAGAVLAKHSQIRAITITVHKPHAPISAIFEDVGVTISRRRDCTVVDPEWRWHAPAPQPRRG